MTSLALDPSLHPIATHAHAHVQAPPLEESAAPPFVWLVPIAILAAPLILILAAVSPLFMATDVAALSAEDLNS